MTTRTFRILLTAAVFLLLVQLSYKGGEAADCVVGCNEFLYRISGPANAPTDCRKWSDVTCIGATLVADNIGGDCEETANMILELECEDCIEACSHPLDWTREAVTASSCDIGFLVRASGH